MEALLKKHVDVDLPGKDKKTPVYTAVEKGHVTVLKLLLASNPDLELCTSVSMLIIHNNNSIPFRVPFGSRNQNVLMVPSGRSYLT